MSRLQKADTADDLLDVLTSFADGEWVEFRPRTTGREDAWRHVEEDHLFNIEANNYRVGEEPDYHIEDGNIHDRDGNYISVSDARKIYKSALVLSKLENYNYPDETEPEKEFPVHGSERFLVRIWKGGFTKVGCHEFGFEDLKDEIKKLKVA